MINAIVGQTKTTTSVSATQTPGKVNPQGSTSSKSAPAPQKLVKESPSVKQQITAMAYGPTPIKITSTNPDAKNTSYLVYNNATSYSAKAYSDGKKLIRTAGMYTVDIKTPNSDIRLGEFNTATAAYGAIKNRGAF
jgi:hypothetical protein